MFSGIAMAIGGAIRVSCYSSLGHMFRWEVSIQSSHKLITTGPYSIVRHPSYTGLAFVTLGYNILLFAKHTVLYECIIPAVGTASGWVIWPLAILRTWVVYWLFSRSIAEDRLLKKEFGEQWEQWAAKTRYRSIPYVF
jgi:protein-S-isoprenylcysteine O-methyltransferase Ste14